MPDKPQERFQGMHNQFVASAAAVVYAHENYPELKIGDMNIFTPSYPLTCNPDDELLAQREMRIKSWFCSDVQCRGAYPTYIWRYFKETASRSRWSPATSRC